jgi:hypothetical protein
MLNNIATTIAILSFSSIIITTLKMNGLKLKNGQ